MSLSQAMRTIDMLGARTVLLNASQVVYLLAMIRGRHRNPDPDPVQNSIDKEVYAALIDNLLKAFPKEQCEILVTLAIEFEQSKFERTIQN